MPTRSATAARPSDNSLSVEERETELGERSSMGRFEGCGSRSQATKMVQPYGRSVRTESSEQIERKRRRDEGQSLRFVAARPLLSCIYSRSPDGNALEAEGDMRDAEEVGEGITSTTRMDRLVRGQNAVRRLNAVEERHEDAAAVPQREEPEARDGFSLASPLYRLADRGVVVALAGRCCLNEGLEGFVAATRTPSECA